jgi:hypothetical protein
MKKNVIQNHKFVCQPWIWFFWKKIYLVVDCSLSIFSPAFSNSFKPLLKICLVNSNCIYFMNFINFTIWMCQQWCPSLCFAFFKTYFQKKICFADLINPVRLCLFLWTPPTDNPSVRLVDILIQYGGLIQMLKQYAQTTPSEDEVFSFLIIYSRP